MPTFSQTLPFFTNCFLTNPNQSIFHKPAIHSSTTQPTQTITDGHSTLNYVQSQQFQQFKQALSLPTMQKFHYLEKCGKNMEIWLMKDGNTGYKNADHKFLLEDCSQQFGNSPKRVGKRGVKGNTIVLPPVRGIWMASKGQGLVGMMNQKKMRKTMLKHRAVSKSSFYRFSVTRRRRPTQRFDRFQKDSEPVEFKLQVQLLCFPLILLSLGAASLAQSLTYSDHQSDQLEMEELDLKWQMAMLSLRINRFEKKAGRKMNYNNKQPARFDRRKVRCYKCLQVGHFARECNVKTVDDKARYSAFKKTRWMRLEKVYGMMAGLHADNGGAGVSDAAAEFAMMGISPKFLPPSLELICPPQIKSDIGGTWVMTSLRLRDLCIRDFNASRPRPQTSHLLLISRLCQSLSVVRPNSTAGYSVPVNLKQQTNSAGSRKFVSIWQHILRYSNLILLVVSKSPETCFSAGKTVSAGWVFNLCVDHIADHNLVNPSTDIDNRYKGGIVQNLEVEMVFRNIREKAHTGHQMIKRTKVLFADTVLFGATKEFHLTDVSSGGYFKEFLGNVILHPSASQKLQPEQNVTCLVAKSFLGIEIHQMAQEDKSEGIDYDRKTRYLSLSLKAFEDSLLPKLCTEWLKALCGTSSSTRAWYARLLLFLLQPTISERLLLTRHCSSSKKKDSRFQKYLKGQPKLGLWYPKDSPFQLEAYSDSDYAGSHGDRKSTTRTIVATSSTEPEYDVLLLLWTDGPRHIEIRTSLYKRCNEKNLIQVEYVFCGILFSCDCRVCVPAVCMDFYFGLTSFCLAVSFMCWELFYDCQTSILCCLITVSACAQFDNAVALVSASHLSFSGSLQSCWCTNVSAE
ncbi:ribonuclease H-like domain-containing protein [Tanacetum coccineum]